MTPTGGADRAFTQPPRGAYEILISDFVWANEPEETKGKIRWQVVDLKLYGRSLYTDFVKINGHYFRWPSFLSSREGALGEGRKLAEYHRDRCYLLNEASS